MTTYVDWFASILAHEAVALEPDQLAEFIGDFCSRSHLHLEQVGADTMGDLIWYLMGSAEQTWHDVVEATHECAVDAILALRLLYERCFAKELTSASAGEGNKLAAACYMLWDMDGGLETVPLCNEPKELVPACYQVLEHALSLDSPACWESALHGLGHVAFSHKQPAGQIIDAFLTAKGSRADCVRDYAAEAKAGCVQ